MLGLSQVDLSESAKCGRSLLNDFENGFRMPRDANVVRIRKALEARGAVFMECAGSLAVWVGPGVASVRTPRARSLGND